MREFSAIWVVVTLILPLVGCDGNPAATQFNRGEQLLTQGGMDTAISCFSQAIDLKPDYAAAYSQRGFAYAYQCKYDDAIADFTEAIRLDPDNGQAYGRRGGAYRHKGEYDKANADLAKAETLKAKK